jgi:hypothetical protein
MLEITFPSLRAGQVVLDPYLERRQGNVNSIDQALLSGAERIRLALTGVRGRENTLIRRIEARAPRLRAMEDRDLRHYAEALRPRLLRMGRAGRPTPAM